MILNVTQSWRDFHQCFNVLPSELIPGSIKILRLIHKANTTGSWMENLLGWQNSFRRLRSSAYVVATFDSPNRSLRKWASTLGISASILKSSRTSRAHANFSNPFLMCPYHPKERYGPNFIVIRSLGLKFRDEWTSQWYLCFIFIDYIINHSYN